MTNPRWDSTLPVNRPAPPLVIRELREAEVFRPVKSWYYAPERASRNSITAALPDDLMGESSAPCLMVERAEMLARAPRSKVPDG
jgi:hypothetical protein